MATDPREIVIAEMRKQTKLLTAILKAVCGQPTGQPQAAPSIDLDSQHGDPIVKAKSPKDWTGDNMTGRRFSECPPEYLDQVAARCEHFVRRDTEKLAEASDDEEEAKLRKSIKYGALDAQRASGWAARKRAGWTAPVAAGRVDETQREPTW